MAQGNVEKAILGLGEVLVLLKKARDVLPDFHESFSNLNLALFKLESAKINADEAHHQLLEMHSVSFNKLSDSESN